MALDSTMIANLIRQFKANPGLLNTILAGDDSQKDILLRMAGVNNPTDKDRGDFDSVFNMLSGSKKAARGDYTSAVNSILKTDPTKLAIETGIHTLGEASHAAADTVLNNYNKLAEAILAGTRTMSGSQREKFGPSFLEKGAEMNALDRQRRGNNIAIWANAIGNIVDKVTGKVERDNALERAAKMRPYDKEMNMSGQYYDSQSRMYGLR